MRLRDIQIGEQYAIRWPIGDAATLCNPVVSHNLKIQRLIRYNNSDETSRAAEAFTDMFETKWQIRRGAVDYGFFVETSRYPKPDGSDSLPSSHHRLTEYFMCGTVLDKGLPSGKTKRGVQLQVPVVDWSPLQQWARELLNSGRVSEDMVDSDVPWLRDERLALTRQIFASPRHAVLLLSAHYVVLPWTDLREQRIEWMVERERVGFNYDLSQLLREGDADGKR